MILFRIAVFALILNVAFNMLTVLGLPFDGSIGQSQNLTSTSESDAQGTVNQLSTSFNSTIIEPDSTFVEDFKIRFSGIVGFFDLLKKMVNYPVAIVDITAGPYLPPGFTTGLKGILYLLYVAGAVQFVRGQSFRDLD